MRERVRASRCENVNVNGSVKRKKQNLRKQRNLRALNQRKIFKGILMLLLPQMPRVTLRDRL